LVRLTSSNPIHPPGNIARRSDNDSTDNYRIIIHNIQATFTFLAI
jgi:hypothetical protein